MKILLSCLSFRNFSGSEIYFYELATAFKKMGHNVEIFTLVKGKPLIDKIGSIKFVNKYLLSFKKYDAVLFSHGLKTWKYIRNVKSKKFINIIHSEVIEDETPIIDNKINNYIAIRPSIFSYISNYIKNDDLIKLIYNPFDFDRFNKNNCKKKPEDMQTILFLGNIDYLRKNVFEYLIDEYAKNNYKIIHVGKSFYKIQHKNLHSFKPVWEVEKFYSNCDISAGIFLGRSTIEGLLCGKKALQFDVSPKGDIKKIYWHTEEDLSKFDKTNVANEFMKLI